MAENGAAKRRNRNIIVGVLALLVGIAGGVAVWSVTKDDGGGQTAGEIILSPAADPGADPFSSQAFSAAPDPKLAQPATPVATPITVAAGQTMTATAGGKEGLYGGTKDKAACDPQKMVDFLAANPDKAAAWVAALNADPNVKLPNGAPLTVATIPDYVASLTPLVLMQDTRVTNHGYKDGKATQLQSVLQKGTAVLVDANGVPRTKCACGNPLLPPVASKSAPKYTGNKWPDFDPTKVGVVDRNPTVIVTFVVTDIATGKTFTLTAGSTITPPTGSTTTTTPRSTTTAATTTTAAGPTTTAATTTTTTGTGTAPALLNPALVRSPSQDSACTTYGPGAVAYDVTVDYVDPDGDANSGTVTLGPNDVTSYVAFPSNGDAGTITIPMCEKAGTTVNIVLTDGAGNASATLSVPIP